MMQDLRGRKKNRNRKGTIVRTRESWLHLTGHTEYFCVCFIFLVKRDKRAFPLHSHIDYIIQYLGPFPILSGTKWLLLEPFFFFFLIKRGAKIKRHQKSSCQFCKTALMADNLENTFCTIGGLEAPTNILGERERERK